MERFTRLTAVAAPLPATDIDTDIIFPARFLLVTAKTGLGRYAFYERRYHPDGSERADFVLNRARYRGAAILVAGNNFGCGSSREQAPWALADLGVRCIISSGFGEIFHANCFRNGILPVTISPSHLAGLMADAEGGLDLGVDLVDQTITRRHGAPIVFEIEAWRREALLSGLDEIALVLNAEEDTIAAFEARQQAAMPWLGSDEHPGASASPVKV